MTAEPEVRSQLSEVSEVVIEDKCGLDMISYEDLPKIGGDCNGVNKHVDDEKEEEEKEEVEEQQNTNVKDDPDASYVFVSRSGSAIGDAIDRDLNVVAIHESRIFPESKVSSLTKDIEGQIGELNGENGETVSAKDNSVAEANDVAPSNSAVAPTSSLVKPNVDGDDVLGQDQDATALVESEQERLHAEVKIEEQIEPDLASDLKENHECPTMALEVAHCGTPQLDDGKMESEVHTPNFESTAELGVVQESQIAVLEAGDIHEGEEKSVEQNNLESIEESEKASVVVSEFSESKLSMLDDSKVNSEKEANIESTTELHGSQESEVMVSEATGCKLPEVEAGNAIAEKQTNFEESEKASVVVSEASESKLLMLDDSRVNSEKEDNIESTTELAGSQESEVLVSEATECKLPEVEAGNAIAEKQTNFDKSDKASVVVSEASESKLSMLDGSRVISEEEANIESTTVLEGSQESEVMVSEATGCKLPEVEAGNAIAEKQTNFGESEKASVVVSEASESKLSMLDDSRMNSEKEANIESPAELECRQESEVMVSEATGCKLPEGEAGNAIAEKQTNFDESEKASVVVSEASESKLSMLDDSRVNSEKEANIESTTELEGCQESEVMVSEATGCKLPEVEAGNAIPEKQTNLESPSEVTQSLESQITMPESSESESFQPDNGEEKLEEEEKTDLRMDIKENQESQLVVTENISSAIDQGNEAAKSDTETDVPLETEIGNEHVSDENNGNFPTSQVEDSISLNKVLSETIDGSQNTNVLNGSSENAENLPSPADCTRPEIAVGSESVENLLSCPLKDAKLVVEVENGTVAGDKISSCNEVSSETDIGLCPIDPQVNSESEVSNTVTEGVCSQPLSVNGLDPEYHANDSLQNGSSADMKSESEIGNSSSMSGMDVPFNDAVVSQSQVLDGSVVNCRSAPNCVPEAFNVQDVRDQVNGGDGDDYNNLRSQETKEREQVHRDEISTSLPEGSSADALDEQSAGLEAVLRPFHFLIKIPRYDDEKLREQIRHAQLQVDEKTKQRDAIQVDIQMIRGNCQQLNNDYGAAKSEERAARGLVKSKRQEIDSVQSVINRVKNAISVEDIDVRMRNMEHMIQHETLPLKEEKQFIREIKQLKHLREQLSSNMGSQDEVQQALDQRHQIEERLKILKKELDCLKDKVSKAEAAAEAAEKKYNDESKKLKELHAQFRAADNIRQEAYAHLQNLRKQLYEKNTKFRMYKDDATTANDYALSGDKGALHRLCVNQVETIMELWNKNDEFRKEYIKCNTRSTLRRLRTLDGRALGPDEESPVLPNVVYERIDRSLSTSVKANSELQIPNLEEEKQVSTVEDQETDGKSMAKVSEQMDQTAKTKKPGKSTLRNGSATVSGRVETEEMSEEEHKQTKEQQELARKEEELRKEEAAAKLKELRRLEEKAKAKEALERKRRHAEKAQIRAELRAQKEAEQKEKEREKRSRKKEKQKASVAEASDGNNEGETVPTSEYPAVGSKESEIKESPLTITRRPQKPFQFTKQSKTKSIPPPLRNRGKKRMQQWIWVILAALLVLALFMLGHFGLYSNLGHNLGMRSSGF